uniref:C-type lectin domain-containing protein n=1 Tax=Pelusios castaneus TaxID=367368 RepID=A0A8C8VJT3_9SAUR
MVRRWLSRCLGPFLATLLVGTTISGVSSSTQSCLCAQGCCPTNWYQYRDSCYYPMTATKSWEKAEADCMDLMRGTHLASVHSAEENNFIYYLMGMPNDYQNKKAYWLGGHHKSQGQSQGSWRWADNSEWDYENFGIGKLDRITGESYVASWQFEKDSITWANHSNSLEFMSICKHPLD